jgi:3-hydroxyisobutyrate dehydrogenase-like beta-hydroxyacid dehydrogenase
VGAHLKASGARIADASIMGTPHTDAHRLPMLASGPAAQEFLELMNPWGLRAEFVEGELGAASGIKIMRSVIAKGLEALLVECMLGASRYGIDAAVLASFDKFMATRTFTSMANFLITTGSIHAERRSHEAEMSAEALIEAGVDPIMTRATVERLTWVHELGVKAHFGGEVPKSYTNSVAAMETLLRHAGEAKPKKVSRAS